MNEKKYTNNTYWKHIGLCFHCSSPPINNAEKNGP